ncbi:hypothetical protein B5C34_11935 [Pacificimonas flava]|uniref:Uncharacterized protein n=2 Tax=Pacificimonas TaxID=1960290 RepID=A0A219B8G9_9SPHN|nr:hypothetical protein B5C34_11935 [Pacificimonas flava]
MQPLSDVGAVRPNIAPELERILDDPYRLPVSERNCEDLSFHITQLNRTLGPDFDVSLEDDKNEDRARRGISIAGKMAAGLLIPFRSIVREVSGASSAEREYKAALVAGIARRSYLKGMAVEKGCVLPLDPYVQSMEAEDAYEADASRD